LYFHIVIFVFAFTRLGVAQLLRRRITTMSYGGTHAKLPSILYDLLVSLVLFSSESYEVRRLCLNSPTPRFKRHDSVELEDARPMHP
jgi:hypothetical protein